MSELERSFTKGHGTENDFVLLPDLDGTRGLSAALARRLSDRRAGIGADGVIRVVPTTAAAEPDVRRQAGSAAWFMDYRNADGSIAEMCGNGTRVFAAYLRREGLETRDRFGIATRAGVKVVRFEDDDLIAVNLGPWSLVSGTRTSPAPEAAVEVTLANVVAMSATRVDVGNPHAVIALPAGVDLAEIDLTRPPVVRPSPEAGTNVEVVDVLGPGHLRMRVHERGVGETRSCGTGAAAAALAARHWALEQGLAAGMPAEPQDVWRVDVPGGTLRVTALPDHQVELAGPAELVADGIVHF